MVGHFRPGRANRKSSHVRLAPKAADNRLATACREGPQADMTPAVGLPIRRFKESDPSQLVMGMKVMSMKVMGMKVMGMKVMGMK